MNPVFSLAITPILVSFVTVSWLQANFLHDNAGAFSVETARVALVLTMMVWAAVLDVRNRTVHDRFWIAFGAIGGLIYIFDLPTVPEAMMIGISLAFAVGMSFAAYRLGLFGGADAFAIIALAVILPIYTAPYMLHQIAPLTALTNAALCSLVQIPINAIRNLLYTRSSKKLFVGFEDEPISRKAVAFLLGYRAAGASRFAFSMEKGVGKREFDFSLKNAETEEFCKRADTWVTSAVPFLVYIAAGAFLMVFVGDLLRIIVNPLI